MEKCLVYVEVRLVIVRLADAQFVVVQFSVWIVGEVKGEVKGEMMSGSGQLCGR